MPGNNEVASNTLQQTIQRNVENTINNVLVKDLAEAQKGKTPEQQQAMQTMTKILAKELANPKFAKSMNFNLKKFEQRNVLQNKLGTMDPKYFPVLVRKFEKTPWSAKKFFANLLAEIESAEERQESTEERQETKNTLKRRINKKKSLEKMKQKASLHLEKIQKRVEQLRKDKAEAIQKHGLEDINITDKSPEEKNQLVQNMGLGKDFASVEAQVKKNPNYQNYEKAGLNANEILSMYLTQQQLSQKGVTDSKSEPFLSSFSAIKRDLGLAEAITYQNKDGETFTDIDEMTDMVDMSDAVIENTPFNDYARLDASETNYNEPEKLKLQENDALEQDIFKTITELRSDGLAKMHLGMIGLNASFTEDAAELASTKAALADAIMPLYDQSPIKQQLQDTPYEDLSPTQMSQVLQSIWKNFDANQQTTITELINKEKELYARNATELTEENIDHGQMKIAKLASNEIRTASVKNFMNGVVEAATTTLGNGASTVDDVRINPKDITMSEDGTSYSCTYYLGNNPTPYEMKIVSNTDDAGNIVWGGRIEMTGLGVENAAGMIAIAPEDIGLNTIPTVYDLEQQGKSIATNKNMMKKLLEVSTEEGEGNSFSNFWNNFDEQVSIAHTEYIDKTFTPTKDAMQSIMGHAISENSVIEKAIKVADQFAKMRGDGQPLTNYLQTGNVMPLNTASTPEAYDFLKGILETTKNNSPEENKAFEATLDSLNQFTANIDAYKVTVDDPLYQEYIVGNKPDGSKQSALEDMTDFMNLFSSGPDRAETRPEDRKNTIDTERMDKYTAALKVDQGRGDEIQNGATKEQNQTYIEGNPFFHELKQISEQDQEAYKYNPDYKNTQDRLRGSLMLKYQEVMKQELANREQNEKAAYGLEGDAATQVFEPESEVSKKASMLENLLAEGGYEEVDAQGNETKHHSYAKDAEEHFKDKVTPITFSDGEYNYLFQKQGEKIVCQVFDTEGHEIIDTSKNNPEDLELITPHPSPTQQIAQLEQQPQIAATEQMQQKTGADA